MVPVVVSVVVDASLQTVWQELADLASHVEWMADAERIEFHRDTRRGPGTVMDVATRVGPFRLVDRLVVTEWEPGLRIAVDHEGLVRGTGRFEMAPMADGIRVRWREDLRFPLWLGGSFTALAAAPVLSWIWRRNLARLRERIEGT